MKRPSVSISVPVYNAEKYLRQCLDSLVNQTLHNIEIVIVNDGSTDGSEAICREYAERDSRIKLIVKDNGGSGSARQAALEACTGQYICGCDADDWVEPTMYELMYNQAVVTCADIVMCDYWREYGNGKQIESHYPHDINKVDDFMDDALNGRFPCQIWNKMFKREIFEKYNISFEPGINLGEDFLLFLKIFQNPVKVFNIPDTLYHYRRDVGGTSYTNNISIETFNQTLFIRKWVIKNIDTKKYYNGVFHLWLSLAVTGLRVNEGLESEYYRKEVISKILYKNFLECSYPKAKGFLVLFTKIFGYDAGRNVYKLLYQYLYK